MEAKLSLEYDWTNRFKKIIFKRFDQFNFPIIHLSLRTMNLKTLELGVVVDGHYVAYKPITLSCI